MNINKIKATNLKGRTFAYDLAPGNIVVGENYAGKSAILDAITIGVLGYHPKLGKTNQLTYQLASGKEMVVEFYYGGWWHSRWWTKNGRGVSATSNDHHLKFPEIMLDAKRFFGMSAQDRTKYVFDRVAMNEAFDRSEMESKLKHSIEFEVEPSQLRESAIDALLVGLDKVSATDCQEYLNGAIEFSKKFKKDADAELKSLAGFTVAQTKLQDDDVPVNVDDDLKAARQDRDALYKQSAELTRAIDKAASLLADREILLTKLEDVHADAVIARCQHDIETHKVAIDHTYCEIVASENKQAAVCPTCGSAVVEWKERYKQKLEKEIFEHKEEISKIEWEVKVRAEALTNELREKLEVLGPIPDMSEQEQELESLQASIKEIDARISELEQMQRRFIAHNQDMLRAEQVRQQQDAAKAGSQAGKVAVTELQALRERIVQDVFAKLLEKANLFTDGILKSPLEYLDGEIGRMEGRTWIPIDTFSGTEEAIAFAGISVALCQDAPIKLVLLDELGRMTDQTKETFVGRLMCLVECGEIDQFILVDVERPAFDAKGLNIIEVV